MVTLGEHIMIFTPREDGLGMRFSPNENEFFYYRAVQKLDGEIRVENHYKIVCVRSLPLMYVICNVWLYI